LINEIKATFNAKSDFKLERSMNNLKPSQPNSNYQIDSFTNIDSFLELEQNESSVEFYTPSHSKSSLNDISPAIHPNQDEEIFLKRKYQDINSSD